MRKIEDWGVSVGISKLVMMENAGHSIADEAMRVLTRNIRRTRFARVALLAGTGNNGGDAFVAARQISYWLNGGADLFLIGNEKEIKAAEALRNWRILKKLRHHVRITNIDSLSKADTLTRKLRPFDLIISGIFGTGFHGEPRAIQKKAIEALNQNSNAVVISIDIPSGMEADSGGSVIAVESDLTVTMFAPKIGMFANRKAKKLCGRIAIANIGIPR